MSSRQRWYESQATSPVSPFFTLPGVWAKRSQIDSPRPSSFVAPSIWYEAVAAPQRKPRGKTTLRGVPAAGAPSGNADGGARRSAEQARPGEDQRLAQELTAILGIPMAHRLSSSRTASPHCASHEPA